MSEPDPNALIIDRPLDPAAADRVKAPGVGVILTPDCNVEMILREASDVARIRGRLIYVFIISSDAEERAPTYPEWEKQIFQKSHAIKSDRFKIPYDQIQSSLGEYSRAFDIRLLMIEEREISRYRFPWSKDVISQINYAPGLPPTFILRASTAVKTTQTFSERYRDWILLASVIGLVWFMTFLTRDFLTESFQLMTYILALAILSSKVSRIVSLVGSFIAALTYNFTVVEPYGQFQFTAPGMWLNIIGLMIVSLIISTLSWQLRSSLAEVQVQEQRKSAFFNLTRDLLESTDMDSVLTLIERHVKDVIGSDVAVFVKRDDEVETLRTGTVDLSMSVADLKARDLALNQGIEAGLGTQAQPLAHGLYIPVARQESFSGCLAVYPKSGAGEFPAEQLRMLDTFAGLLGISLQRIWFEEIQLDAERQIRDASLQNTLLRSVSHDLKTPLTSITGFANQLFESPDISIEERKHTYQTIRDEAWRLTNLINNLLSLTKLESGVIKLNKELMFVEEIFGTAVSQVRPRLHSHKIKIDLPENVPDVMVDSMLMNQALINLIENAIKYTPPGTNITVRARKIDIGVQLTVLDDGPGLPKGSTDKIFDKFVRSVEGRQVEGTGLGLAIVRAIAELHDGTATAANRTNKGARFDIRIPAATEKLGSQKEEENEHSN
jgi:two-component system, OmpR family, sensor histidine kinase KdpD